MARRVQNFIDGTLRDSAEGRTAVLVDPATGKEFAEAPVSGPADIDAAMNAASRAFPSWRDATPSERSLALLRIADALEERRKDLVQAECENTGKPFQLTMDEELPPMVDQIRFFAGAARMLGGAGRDGVHARPHLLDPPGTHRRLRSGHTLELSHDDGGVEVGTGACRRQYRGVETL